MEGCCADDLMSMMALGGGLVTTSESRAGGRESSIKPARWHVQSVPHRFEVQCPDRGLRIVVCACVGPLVDPILFSYWHTVGGRIDAAGRK